MIIAKWGVKLEYLKSIFFLLVANRHSWFGGPDIIKGFPQKSANLLGSVHLHFAVLNR